MKLFIVFIVGGLILLNFQKSIIGTGPVETKIYNISEFSSFNITGNLTVTVNIGDEYLVQVTTNNNIFDYLDISVEDDTLIFIEKDNINIKDTDIKMHIICPEISYIKLANSADMTILDTLECNKLDIDISNSANLLAANLKVDNNTNIELSNSSDMNISDMFECSELDIDISNSANLSAANLKVDSNTNIELSNSSDMNISDMFECSKLNIDISNSANLSANNVHTKTCVIDGHIDSELQLVGNTSELYLDLYSGTKALLSNFITENAEVELSNSSKAEINATNNIYLDGNNGSEITIYNGNLILADQNKYNGVTIKTK